MNSKARPQLRTAVPVYAEDIRHGMFITALDRPWEGTPFLLQGFLVEHVDQLDTVRALCSAVVIDPTRSSPESLRGVNDLYALPTEESEDETEAPMHRVRYVQNDYKDTSAAVQGKALIARLRKGINAPLKRLRGDSDLEAEEGDRGDPDAESREKAAAAPKRTVRAKPSAERSAAAMPRFEASKITYVSADGAPPDEAADATVEPDEVSAGAAGLAARARAKAEREKEAPQFDNLGGRTSGIRSFVNVMLDFWESIRERVLERGSRPSASKDSHRIRDTRRPTHQRVADIPASIELVIYRDASEMREEVTPARAAIDATQNVLGMLRRDVAMEDSTRVQGLPIAVEALVESVQRNPDALIWISRLRGENASAYAHGINVSAYLLAFGRHLGFQAPELSQLATIGLLMDVGKAHIDQSILNKKGNLTEEEFTVVKSHVEVGLVVLEESMVLDPKVREGIAQHHERHDGAGYPRQLAGNAISIFGRMASIADTFAAMTTPRVYAAPVSSYDALYAMHQLGGQQFNPAMVQQFIQAIGLFPVGSLVLLSSGEVGAVVSHSSGEMLKPRVLVMSAPDKILLHEPFELDLAAAPKDARGKPIRIARSLPAGAYMIDTREYYLG